MAVEKRLMHYASFDTQSSEESTSAPSTEKQLVLARELKKECESLGFDSVELTDTGIVYAYLNANTDKRWIVLVLLHIWIRQLKLQVQM